MLKRILKEEEGISNKVSLFVLKLKNKISTDFGKNKYNESLYKILPLVPNKTITVINDSFDDLFDNEIITIEYNVGLPKTNQELVLYKKKYQSEMKMVGKKIILYLTLNENNKINWKLHLSSLQHEVHHLFQTIKKGKPLIDVANMGDYNFYQNLLKSEDESEKIIGYTLYYAIKAEKEAFSNGLYREIMEQNKETYNTSPIKILQSNITYKNIKYIDFYINNKKKINSLKSKLLELHIDFNSYINIAFNVVENYIKSFSRIVYKAKQDLSKLYNDTLK